MIVGNGRYLYGFVIEEGALLVHFLRVYTQTTNKAADLDRNILQMNRDFLFICSYREVWLLGTCTYIFRRNVC